MKDGPYATGIASFLKFEQCLLANDKPSSDFHTFETETEYSLPLTSWPNIPIG